MNKYTATLACISAAFVGGGVYATIRGTLVFGGQEPGAAVRVTWEADPVWFTATIVAFLLIGLAAGGLAATFWSLDR